MTGQTYLANLKDTDELIKTCMKRWHVPGAAVAIVTDKEVLLAKGYGFRDARKKEPVTAKTIFPIASITKSFTAMGVALLVAGKFYPTQHYHYNIFELVFEDSREKVYFIVNDKGEIGGLEFRIEVALPAAKFEKKTRKRLKVKGKS